MLLYINISVSMQFFVTTLGILPKYHSIYGHMYVSIASQRASHNFCSLRAHLFSRILGDTSFELETRIPVELIEDTRFISSVALVVKFVEFPVVFLLI